MKRQPRRIKRVPNYLRKLETARALGVFEPGTITIANVFHDDGCAYWKGGVCNCDPHVKLEPAKVE